MKRIVLGLAAILTLSLATLLVPDAWLAPVLAQSDDAAVSKARTLESPSLLQVPDGLKGGGFTLAKVAPKIDVVMFAGLKDRGKGTLWSSWGDGCLHSNGKYYTSIGDHLGVDATSYVYEYDPATRVMRRVVDVLRALMQMLGIFGHGKIHSGIHEAADGSLYFATYWGKQREIDAHFGKNYEGSIVMRYDPKSEKTENLGAIAPRQGLPASHFDASRQHLYFHVVYKSGIAAYDVKNRKMVFRGGADVSTAERTFIADAKGRVYFSGIGDVLHVYDPETKKLAATKAKLPAAETASKKADTLRAAAQRPAKDGTLYGMTAAGRLFALNPVSQEVKDLGPNFTGGHYTAVMAISPDDKYLYYAPGAHGSNAKIGTPVVQFEIATGKKKVLAFLSDAMLKERKFQIGGTYNLQLDPAGEHLFITFNGAPATARRGTTFGEPCVMVLTIPREER